MFDLSPKVKKRIRAGLKVFVVLALVGIAAWLLVINPLLIREERKRFDAASESLKQLADEIQTKIGPADEVIKDESCGRANLKSEEGPLGCNTNYSLVFSTKNTDETNLLLQNASEISSNPLRKGPLADGTTFVNNPSANNTQIIYQNIGFINNLSCVTSYEYRIQPSSEELSESHVLKIVVNCGGPAKAEHFPVKD